MEGYVRKMFLEKGFAFIEGSDERDYFLHWSKVSRNSVPFRNMKENDKVKFDIEEGNNGPKALNVLIVRGEKNDNRSPALSEPEASNGSGVLQDEERGDQSEHG